MNGLAKARFEAVLTEGRRVGGSFSRLTALPGSGHIGIGTSKKIGARPARNKVRRRFAEAIRTAEGLVDSRLDYVLIASQSSAGVPFGRIQEEVMAVFGRANEKWAPELESF